MAEFVKCKIRRSTPAWSWPLNSRWSVWYHIQLIENMKVLAREQGINAIRSMRPLLKSVSKQLAKRLP